MCVGNAVHMYLSQQFSILPNLSFALTPPTRELILLSLESFCAIAVVVLVSFMALGLRRYVCVYEQ